MNKKGIIYLIAILSIFLLMGCAYSSGQSDDSQLGSMIKNVEDNYTQQTFNDPKTGLEIEYNLYLPNNYDNSKKYPMVVFIADSSLVGKDPIASLEQSYGGIIWANDTWDSQKECIVLVPTYSEVIIDDMNGNVKTEYLNATKNLIDNITSQYPVDAKRIYGTGQSMGGMTMLYLSSKYPDLFAAELFVSCQWNISELQNLDSQKFFYIASAGDEKASAGQSEVMEMLNGKNIKYNSVNEIDAQSVDENDKKINELLNEKNNINFVTFKTGTVISEDSAMSDEHMSSFDYAYKLKTVRDWLFNQSR